MRLTKASVATALTGFALFAATSSIANAEFFDSWTNTYSPTWTPLSLDQMVSKKSSSSYSNSPYKIDAYQPVIAPTPEKTVPPADLLVPEGGKGVRISKGGSVSWLDTEKLLTFGTKSNFDTKEITFLLSAGSVRATLKIGTITHYNPGADSFGYVDPRRMELDPVEYGNVGSSVMPAANFTVPEGAIAVRIKEWGEVRYINNNASVSGAKADIPNLKIVGSIFNEGEELGKITVNNYKQYDNVDSFGYIYPEKLNYAFSRGKGANGLPPTPADMTVPNGALGVRIGDWGSVYYLSNNKQVSPTAFGKLSDSSLVIVEKDANGVEKEIGKISNLFQDVDIYSYGYVYKDRLSDAVETPPVSTPPQKVITYFKDVPDNADLLKALTYAAENGWVKRTMRFYPNSKISKGRVAELVMRASGATLLDNFTAVFSDVKATNSLGKYIYTGYSKGYWKEYPKGSGKFGVNTSIQRASFRKILKTINGFDSAKLKSNLQKALTKADAVIAVYEAFGVK